MTATLSAPTETDITRIAELTRDGITLRLAVTDGQPWIALERANADGTTACIGMPLKIVDLGWIVARVSQVWTIPDRAALTISGITLRIMRVGVQALIALTRTRDGAAIWLALDDCACEWLTGRLTDLAAGVLVPGEWMELEP